MKARHWANPWDGALLLWPSVTGKERDLTGESCRLQYGCNIPTRDQTGKWQRPCAKLNKSKHSYFWMEGSCFQENCLENSSCMFYVSPYVWEVPQKPSCPSPSPPLCPTSSWRLWGWVRKGDQYLAPNSSRLLLQTSFPFFTTTAPWCLPQGILELCLPALFILCFYKFHVLLPFILCYLNCMTLREWNLFSWLLEERIPVLETDFMGKCWRQWNIIARKMCLVSLSASERFYYSTKQRSRSAFQGTASSSHTRTKMPRTKRVLLLHISPSQQRAPHLSSHQLISAASQCLKPDQDKLFK